jgi:hypothetical protein
MPALLRQAAPVALLLLLTACDVRVSDNGVSMGVFSGRASETWTRSYTLPKGGRLEIVSTSGPITVTAASGPTVEVKVEREARSASDEEAKASLAESPVQETVDAASARVEIRRTTRSDQGGPRRGGQMTSSVTVSLPAGLEASFTTENGAIRIDQVDGQLRASTSNAAINGNGLAGSIAATAVNGGIRIAMQSVAGEVELSVVNGGIELLLPTATRARLEATALNGGVSVDDRLQLVAEEGADGGPARRRIQGTLNGGGPLVSAQATNGGVRISAAQEQAAR